jgi:hypothetical protein
MIRMGIKIIQILDILMRVKIRDEEMVDLMIHKIKKQK